MGRSDPKRHGAGEEPEDTAVVFGFGCPHPVKDFAVQRGQRCKRSPKLNLLGSKCEEFLRDVVVRLRAGQEEVMACVLEDAVL
ncbi:hypothetical protein D3C78_768190 [compost metagenome]